MLDREEAARSRPLGRALDLGRGRGLSTTSRRQTWARSTSSTSAVSKG